MATTDIPTAPAGDPTSFAVSETGPSITLHWLEKSRSQRILWLLEELHLKYDLKTYKRGKDMLAGPDLKKIHPLGKSPVITVKPGSAAGPDAPEFALAESAFIVEYLTEHFGGWLIPQRYKTGLEGVIGGETEGWKRYRQLMHYAEGSLMGLMVMALVVENIAKAPVPFFIKPITKRVAGGVNDQFLTKSFETHFGFLEEQLKTAPDNGEFFCGKELSGVDIMLIYPIEAALERGIAQPAKYPTLKKWVDKIVEREAYKRAIQKIIDATGEYDPVI